MPELNMASSELILGGQKSGKSRRAEQLAAHWLAIDSSHKAVLIATALAHDDEMQQRIARHQADRLLRVPGMQTVEVPHHLADALLEHSNPQTLLVVDCLTLWLTNWLMPLQPLKTFEEKLQPETHAHKEQAALLLRAIGLLPGPVVLVGNEIGLGVIPMGSEVRAFVDTLGVLNQSVAHACQRVTLMAAGLPLTLKGEA